jgi:phosphatidylethanolamine-binding protein (PEBP) family uncharacterized protein
MINTSFATIVVGVASLISAASAHHPDPSMPQDGTPHQHGDLGSARIWTNAKTGEVVRGTFLASKAGIISIERENGDVVAFPVVELGEADRAEAERRIAHINAINERLFAAAMLPAQPAVDVPAPGAKLTAKPLQAATFDHFAPFVKTRWDEQWLYVESDGLPHAPAAHQMMVGIKSWQQQVPLPQSFAGENAFRIPLKPELADKPISGKTELRRGAIALAANGIPIFNALNNRGDDALKAGELDDFGGHCGRADDYHYHTAPLQLQKVVGKDKPIAYALDGFPIYGLFEPGAKKGDEKCCPLGSAEKLDDLNGHFGINADGSKGQYHYHASTTYPYINGGMRGKVSVQGDGIEPQPRTPPVREAGRPLRGATITGFKSVGPNSWALEYLLGGKTYGVNYRIEGGKYLFDFLDPSGEKKSESFTKRDEGGGGRGRRGGDGANGPRGDRPPPPPDGERPRRDDAPGQDQAIPALPSKPVPGFVLSSAAVGADGKLPAEFTCDGASTSPPLSWVKPPAGTKSFAVTMHHFPGPPRPGDKKGEDKHVYIVLYNIPTTTTTLEKGTKSVGIWGTNTVNRRTEYAPPCSKGPGAKKYTLTVYALSSEPKLKVPQDRVTMDDLLDAIKDSTLATSTLDVAYSRP